MLINKFVYFCSVVYDKQRDKIKQINNTMRKKIELTDRDARKKIRETFGVSSMSLSLALNFKRNSDKCVKMRKMALDNGGVMLQEAN